jgi:hypothetical protein
MKRLQTLQPNLFEPTPLRSKLSLPMRAKALELLKSLLREALPDHVVDVEVSARTGGRDDQDHT